MKNTVKVKTLKAVSFHDYEMLEMENEGLKYQFDQLKDEKMVFLTLEDPKYNPHAHQMRRSQIVKKDELLNRMQKHLDRVKKQSVDLELEYKKRIQELEDQLRQASINPVETVIKWWHKLLK